MKTYRELLVALQTLSPDQLDQKIMVYDPNGYDHIIDDLLFAQDLDIPGSQVFLVVEGGEL